MQITHAIRPAIWVLLGLALVGCAASNGSSSDSAAPVPQTLKDGTASEDQASAWAAKVLHANGKPDAMALQLIPGGPHTMFLFDPAQAGKSVNTYLVFRLWKSGLSYAGKLVFLDYRPAPPDADQRPRVVTYCPVNADDGLLALYTLTDAGFELTSQLTIHAGQNGVDRALYAQFFGNTPVSQILIAKTFPKSTLSTP